MFDSRVARRACWKISSHVSALGHFAVRTSTLENPQLELFFEGWSLVEAVPPVAETGR